jgi:hypothetical protein
MFKLLDQESPAAGQKYTNELPGQSLEMSSQKENKESRGNITPKMGTCLSNTQGSQRSPQMDKPARKSEGQHRRLHQCTR